MGKQGSTDDSLRRIPWAWITIIILRFDWILIWTERRIVLCATA